LATAVKADFARNFFYTTDICDLLSVVSRFVLDNYGRCYPSAVCNGTEY